MQRRSALKHLFFIAGSIMVLPSCLASDSLTLDLNHLKISKEDELLLSEICETIIPYTKDKIPGSKELGLHLFVLKMIDDCYEEKIQQSFVRGLKQVNVHSENQFGSFYNDISQFQRKALLKAIEKEAKENSFYALTKNLTIKGFLASEYVMTHKIQPYEHVPARFNGSFPVDNLPKYL